MTADKSATFLAVGYLTELLGRCALRDQEAFIELYEATSAKLFGISLRILRSEHWAEESLQEAYMKIWRAAGTYNMSRGTPMTWMINVVRNQALDVLRRSEFSVEEDELHEELPSSITSTLEHIETSDELDRLRRCLNVLREEQQQCILMIYHEGYTPTEVAKRNNLPLGTVKTWLRRGLQHLRECMRR